MEKKDVDISSFSDLMVVNVIVKHAWEKSFFGDYSGLEDIDFMKGDPELNWIYSVTQWCIIQNMATQGWREKNVYDLFKRNYKNVLGCNCEIVKKKNNPKNIPDFWIMQDAEYIPVECKVDDFTVAGLKQLQRYMDFYECGKGIAVARDLKCELPANIKFIKYDDLREKI